MALATAGAFVILGNMSEYQAILLQRLHQVQAELDYHTKRSVDLQAQADDLAGQITEFTAAEAIVVAVKK